VAHIGGLVLPVLFFVANLLRSCATRPASAAAPWSGLPRVRERTPSDWMGQIQLGTSPHLDRTAAGSGACSLPTRLRVSSPRAVLGGLRRIIRIGSKTQLFGDTRQDKPTQVEASSVIASSRSRLLG
jgi:hypothetical protein